MRFSQVLASSWRKEDYEKSNPIHIVPHSSSWPDTG